MGGVWIFFFHIYSSCVIYRITSDSAVCVDGVIFKYERDKRSKKIIPAILDWKQQRAVYRGLPSRK